MSSPIPGPAGRAPAPPPARRHAATRAGLTLLTVLAGTALLGLLAGLVWAAIAPRALLVMTGPRTAALVNAETSAFVAADGLFCLVCLAGGVVSGAAGYLLAVRRHGPLGMTAVLAGAVAAGFTARWAGQQPGLATFRHLLATLPAGAHLHDALMLRSAGALAFWPLAAGMVAGGLTAIAGLTEPRPGASGLVPASPFPPAGPAAVAAGRSTAPG
jgi:hypothetical protein